MSELKKEIKRNGYFIISLGIVILTTIFFSVLGPFVLGIFIAILIEPIVKFMEKTFYMKRNIGTLISMVFILFLIATTIFLILGIILNELGIMLNQWSRIYTFINKIMLYLHKWLSTMGIIKQWEANFENIAYNSILTITKNLDTIRQGFINAFENFSSSILFCIISMISAYFISKDKKYFLKILKKILPSSLYISTKEYIIDLLSLGKKMIFIYIQIILVTTIQIILGLYILGIPFPFSIGILAGIADILPIIGPGIVFLPGILYCLIIKNYYLSLGLLILFIIININRQILQMKLVNKEFEIHSLFIIFAIYVGYKLIGIAGIFIGPIILVMLKNFIYHYNKRKI